jgi:hypothetical protein
MATATANPFWRPIVSVSEWEICHTAEWSPYIVLASADLTCFHVKSRPAIATTAPATTGWPPRRRHTFSVRILALNSLIIDQLYRPP